MWNPGRIVLSAKPAEQMVTGLFPTRCAVCGSAGVSPCRCCVIPIRIRAVPLCPAPPLWCATVVSPFAYDGAVRTLITAAKYRGNTRALLFLAGRMAEAVLESRPEIVLPATAGGDLECGQQFASSSTARFGWNQPLRCETVVTWAPTSPQRRRRRGYDQAQILAQHTATLLGLRCQRLLVHRSDRRVQTGATREERSQRAERFRAVPFEGTAASFRLGQVLLVDDVMTTGATLSGAARVLRDVGAPSVHAVVAAITL